MLTEKEVQFIKRREMFTSTWKMVAGLILSGLGALFIWLYFSSPYLVNPVAVAKGLEEGTIDVSTLNITALILPVVIILLFLVIAIMFLLGYSVIANEKKYLSIIARDIDSQVPEDDN